MASRSSARNYSNRERVLFAPKLSVSPTPNQYQKRHKHDLCLSLLSLRCQNAKHRLLMAISILSKCNTLWINVWGAFWPNHLNNDATTTWISLLWLNSKIPWTDACFSRFTSRNWPEGTRGCLCCLCSLRRSKTSHDPPDVLRAFWFNLPNSYVTVARISFFWYVCKIQGLEYACRPRCFKIQLRGVIFWKLVRHDYSNDIEFLLLFLDYSRLWYTSKASRMFLCCLPSFVKKSFGAARSHVLPYEAPKYKS